MIRSNWGYSSWFPRGYMAAGLGYPYQGGYCYPYWGCGYPMYGYGFYNNPYYVM